MPIILAHGQPICQQLPVPYLAEVLPGTQDFIETVSEDILRQLVRSIPDEVYYVLKTHGPLEPGGPALAPIAELSRRERVLALCIRASTARLTRCASGRLRQRGEFQ